MSIEIQESGTYSKVDEDGFLINSASVKNIQDNWKPVVDDVVAAYKKHCADALHSIYIRGSVVKGTAVVGISDIDTFAYVNLPRENISMDWVDVVEQELFKKYPFVQGFELSVDPVTAAHEDRLMLLQSVCVYGTDLIGGIPRARPGKDMVVHALTLESRYDWLRKKLETLDDPEELQKGCLWLMKLFLRSGFELTMERSKTYTRDLYPCYETFSKYYPEKEPEMREILYLALNPVANKKMLFDMMSGFGQWLKQEAGKQFP